MRVCPICSSSYPNHHATCAKDGALLVGSRRVPRWVREPSVIVLASLIVAVGLALGLPKSTITKQAMKLDVSHHDRLAKVLLNLACARSDEEACIDLGQGYRNVADYTRAAAVFSKACDSGYADGCHELGHMYEGYGLAKDASRAAMLYSREAAILSRRCDEGDVSVCFDMAEEYDLGFYVTQDYGRASMLYSKVCFAGKAEACNKLGEMYASGQGVPEDQFKANSFYSKACNSGDPQGCTGLALQYEFGEGADVNMPRARQLWSKACKMGEEFACAAAAKLK